MIRARSLSPEAASMFGPTHMTYASRDIEEGELIESSPMIMHPYGSLEARLEQSKGFLSFYPYPHSDEKGYRGSAMGALCRYGLSNTPNTEVRSSPNSRILSAYALRSIKRGEHLTRLQELEGYPSSSRELEPIHFDSHSFNTIQVDDSEWELGVFATDYIKEGDLVEECPMQLFHDDEYQQTLDLRYDKYYFDWPQLGSGRDDISSGIALGYGSIYNHSFDPNMQRSMFYSRRLIHFYANRDIEPGEQLFHHYGWSKNDHRLEEA